MLVRLAAEYKARHGLVATKPDDGLARPPKYNNDYIKGLVRAVKAQHLAGEYEHSWSEGKAIAAKAKRTAFR